MTNPFIQQTIGIIGGGQLGKMMAQSAKRQGYRVVILDPQEDCPAAQVSDQHIVADYNDYDALKNLAEQTTVITYEFENVDCQTIEQCIPKHQFPQGTKTLRISQNRLLEKQFLTETGLPVGKYQAVYSDKDVDEAVQTIGYPCVLKTTRFGYDGKGQVVLRSPEDLTAAYQLVQASECVLEAWVPFVKEVSMMISRNEKGESSLFPVSENNHVHNILHTSIVPARIEQTLQGRITHYTKQIADALGLVGTLGVEYFVCGDGSVYVNEIAPRPHNSGHYSMEACNFSQFDTSIQAVLNLPMPTIIQYTPVVMVNVLGQHVEQVYALKQKVVNWHFHDYGKEKAVHNRKMGHVTVLSDCIEDSLKQIVQTNIWT